MGKIRTSLFYSVSSNTLATVSSDDSDTSNESDNLNNQISQLTQMLKQMNTRLLQLESGKEHSTKKSFISVRPVQVKSAGAFGAKVREKYVLFGRGDDNPKGGVHEFSHLEKVYLSDENKEAIVQGETRLYAWVLVVDEISPRRKLKEKSKRLRL